MVRTHGPMIISFASQCYFLAAFLPHSSNLRTVWNPRLPLVLQTGLPEHWEAKPLTIEAPGHVHSVVFSSDGDHVLCGLHGGPIRIWGARTRTNIRTLQDEGRGIWSIDISPDGRTVVSGGRTDGNVRIWDAQTGACIASAEAHSNWVIAVAFSPDGRHAASGLDDNTVALWDLDDTEFRPAHVLEGHTDQVTSVVFSHDGSHLLSGSEYKSCRVWNVKDRSHVRTLLHTSFVQAVSISPDDQTIACGCFNGSVYLWGKDGTSPYRVVESEDRCIWALDFSPNGHTLVIGSSGLITLWDTASEAHLAKVEQRASCLRFSPDGSHLVSCENNNVPIPLGESVGLLGLFLTT